MSSARYFHVSSGLRGCYMPDSASVVMCRTRRELIAALSYECRYQIRNCGMIGGSKRTIAAIGAAAWKNYATRKTYLPHVIPYGHKEGNSANYCFGIFVSASSRSEGV